MSAMNLSISQYCFLSWNKTLMVSHMGVRGWGDNLASHSSLGINHRKNLKTRENLEFFSVEILSG